MKEFNWDEFKKEKIAVHCNTMQGTKDFINKCYENNIDWYDASKSETLSFLCKHYNPCRYFAEFGGTICVYLLKLLFLLPLLYRCNL